MPEEPVWERADVVAILSGIFGIDSHLATIVALLKGEDEEEEQDEG